MDTCHRSGVLYLPSLGGLNEPCFISKTWLKKITLCNDDGIFQVCLQRVIIINLVPQKHKEAEQKDTKQCDCMKGQDSSFTTFFFFSLFQLCQKAPDRCGPRCQTDQTTTKTKCKPDNSTVYFCYPQTEEYVESCPGFLSTVLKGIILLITTDRKEKKASRPRSYILFAIALAPLG